MDYLFLCVDCSECRMKGWVDCFDWILRSMCCSVCVATTLLLLEEGKIFISNE